MRKLVILVTFTVIAVACSTTSKFQNLAPPYVSPLQDLDPARVDPKSAELFLTRYNQENRDPSSQWWGRYSLAMLLRSSNSQESCLLFKNLSQETDFPLNRLAYLHSLQVCPIARSDLENILGRLKDPAQSYLKQLTLEIGIQRTEAKEFKDLRVLFASEKSKLSVLQKEKVYLLEEALKAARETHQVGAATEIQNSLYKVAPRLNPNPKQTDLLDVANDLRNARQFKQARRIYYDELEKPSQNLEAKLKIYGQIAKTYKLEENKKLFVQTQGSAWSLSRARFKKSPKNELVLKLYAQTAMKYLRALWTENSLEEAYSVIAMLNKDLKNSPLLDEVFWLQARMLEEKGDFQQALDLANKGIQISRDAEIKEKLEWTRAWTLRKTGDLPRAAQALESLSKHAKSAFDRLKYRFWLARVYREDQRFDEARTLLTELTEEDSMGYYGLLAFREMGKDFPPLEKSVSKGDGTYVAAKESPFSTSQTETLNWLISVGEQELARNYLDQIADSKVLASESSRHSVLLYFAKAGHYKGIFDIFSRLSNQDKKSFFKKYPNFIFPSPYESIAREASGRFGISQELIYSIMRQESSFNPYARSPSDAFGLMQMIPRTAKEAAEKIQTPYREPDDLHRPFISIPLGASALRSLWDHYNGQFVLTVASYNADEDAVLGWVKTRFRKDPLEFIEDIPYEETRTYVKLVLRNFIFYERLKSDGSTHFPEWCLESLQDFKS